MMGLNISEQPANHSLFRMRIDAHPSECQQSAMKDIGVLRAYVLNEPQAASRRTIFSP